jgi:glyoxylate/hydroxypyruvate reductase A
MKLLFEATLDAAERAEWWRALTAALPDDEWLDGEQANEASRADVDVAIVANPRPGRLAGSPRLRLVQSLWAGVDKLLADATLPPAVPLARMVDPAMNAAMAETACWAVLSLQRGFLDYAAQQRALAWRPLPQRRADETPVLVLGLGEMGRTAARRIAALGFPVTGWSRTARAVDPASGIEVVHGADALDAALARAAVVVNLLPLTPDTRGLLDAVRLSRLPTGASLVNLARGAHVVEADLLAALEAGHLHRAVLDVFATEPLPAGHAFWTHPRVTVLPHVAALTDLRTAVATVAANVEAVRRGEPPRHLVDRGRGY